MILVYINSDHGISKGAMEVVTYGKKLGDVTAGNASDSDLATLGQYGASKVLVDRNAKADDAQQLTRLVANAATTVGAKMIIFSHDLIAKSVAPRLSVKLKAGLISGAIALPETGGDFTCKVNVFSGKAFGTVKVNTDIGA